MCYYIQDWLHRKCCSNLGHLVHVSLIRSRMKFSKSLTPPSVCALTSDWLTCKLAYLLMSTGPPVCTDESIITTCSRLGPSCLIALNPVTELHQWTACEGNPKHDRPFLDLSMAQLSIHAKIHSPICPNWFLTPWEASSHVI